MSKRRIFIVSLILLTLVAILMPSCDNETDTSNNPNNEITEEYTLTIIVNPSGGGITSPAVGTHYYDDGTELDVTATPADGYVFDHWSGDVEETTTSGSIAMTSNKSITANFALAYDLTVNVDPVEAGEVTLSVEGPYKEDMEVTLTVTPADGYVFSHWSGAVSGDTNPVTITMDSDKTVTANFALAYDLTVNVDPVEAGEVTLSEEGPYKEDMEVTLAATPADGYIFDHWSGAVSGDTNPVTITMDSDKTVTAHFALAYDLTVNVDPVEAGEVTLSEEGPYKEDMEVTLTATPAVGYVFDHWSGAVSGDTNPVTITMDSDKTVIAHFTPVMYTLTVIVSASKPNAATVDIDPLLDSYEPYTEVTLTVNLSSPSYSFLRWEKSGGQTLGYEESITIIMDSDKKIYAKIDCG
ncbi:InlB B-repeat-containing protein [Chloroflexota bacterium]